MAAKKTALEKLRKKYPEKFASEETMFSHIHRGGRIFIGTACAEPQHLVSSLAEYVSAHPKTLFDEEVIQVWTLGVAPYTKYRFRPNFRHNSFYVGENTRSAVNRGAADYTPVSLSNVPDLFRRGLIPLDVALIQTTPPDEHGCLNLGVSVDIVKAAVECASVVIAQINPLMPRVHGDGFIKVTDVDYIMPYEEPVLEYVPAEDDKVAKAIGEYAARLVHDGDTIQVGYGGLPDAILAHLKDKRDLGVHTEVLTEGIVGLMETGVVNNSKKTVDRGKTVASFCMGDRRLYDYIDDNLGIELRTVDYTNSQLIIAQQDNMVAINSAYQIDLTGQATSECIGSMLYSGIGGGVDFMRGAVLSQNGKTILLVRSTTEDGTRSNILPSLAKGCGVTYNRGDVHYVVTEYGIAYLHGRNIRERAMELISIAAPKFRAALIKEAKRHKLIYRDQAFIPGKRGQYPEHLEAHRTTRSGLQILMRPVRISDEPLLKDFFYSLSDVSLYRRFISARKDIPHARLQDFTIIDYTKQMEIVVVVQKDEVAEIIGAGQYKIDDVDHTGDVAFAIRDAYQNMGVGTELVSYLTYLGKKRGLLGFTAIVLTDNARMLHLFEKMGFDINRRREDEVYELKMMFR
jgi:acyl-CoA hydrolase/ribosomal protein S18 acetylase RimI-like enzyme